MISLSYLVLRQGDDVDVVFVPRLRDGEVGRRWAPRAGECDDRVMVVRGRERCGL